MHCFSFDIETVPDVEFGRRMWNLDGVPDEDVATAMTFKQLQKNGREFLPLHQHRVVAEIDVRPSSGISIFCDETLGPEPCLLLKQRVENLDRRRGCQLPELPMVR